MTDNSGSNYFIISDKIAAPEVDLLRCDGRQEESESILTACVQARRVARGTFPVVNEAAHSFEPSGSAVRYRVLFGAVGTKMYPSVFF